MTSLPPPPDRVFSRMPTPVLGERTLFPDLLSRVYLNHAAISPPSTHVLACAAEVPQSYARLGVEAFPLWISQRNRLRGTIAQLIGANPEDIGLVPSTSMGINAIALSMDWQSGDRVVLFDGEFPTNITPWQRASIEFGLQISMLSLDGFGDDSGTGLARLESELRQGVRLVAVSAVQFQTGLAMPLKAMGALCKRYGALLAVDAIQAAGAMPLDVVRDGIDFLAAGSHKWLMGLEGCGFVYISPRQMERLVPRVAGWLSHEDGLRFLFEGEGHLRYDRPIRRRADWLEIGAQNTVGFAALEASVDILIALGIPTIHRHILRWCDALEAPLLARGFRSLRAPSIEARAGILSVRAPPGRDVLSIARHLNHAGVAVTAPDGKLRFAPHWPNAIDEVAQVIEAIDLSP